ncbi:LTA synthase family protein [Planctobacterium marinum]|uniref:LTA synthase family protein n=1 Tax=Planctobacterium marinum TaxID=1631968 RepID=UPI001E5168E7|nr:LTA synthase family protein [Planctobacterium marinum]MCC2605311.1 LTA synthase family protein [Planctobacterium marinum]
MFTSIFYALRPFLAFAVATLLFLTLSRLGLSLWQLDRFEEPSSLLTLVINGFRIDLSAVGYIFALPALAHIWFLGTKMEKAWFTVLKCYFFVAALAFIFFELATPAFITEYGFRPNRLFIEYLNYPEEVSKMLINGHLLTLIIVFSLLVLPSKYIWQKLELVVQQPPQLPRYTWKKKLLSFFTLFLLVFLCARGTLGHRPINPAFVYFSTDPLINSLTLNSAYSVAHAYDQFGDEKNAAKLYGKMEDDRVIELVRQESKQPLESFKNDNLPTLTKRPPSFKGQPKNLVIILEESLGAQYVSSLGGIPLTPEIDKLNQEGWAFKRLYATGTRSVRGIEAVITGFTPTPSRAVVKLDKSQKDFFTIASLLKENGYETQFIYGGESHFDNMKSFFLGNGFTDIVDFNDIENPQFVASWGASDGDLFNQADIELTKLHNEGKPFFSFIFTSSNHDPFEIPDSIVSPIQYTDEQLQQYDGKELLRHKAIQYADYVLGQFIAKAKMQAYWENTIFLVVADHDARATGKDLVPINNFHIPGVILNSGKEPTLDKRIVSQIDLAPTLLSLMGIENISPMLGQDLTDPTASNRAMMQYAENFAYMINDEVTILQPSKAPLNFQYNYELNKISPIDINRDTSEIALAHVLWGSLAYKNHWYSLKKE